MPIGASFEFGDFCLEGGGDVAYVWYCAGFPYALTTKDVTLSTTQKRRMFGARNLDAYSNVYPADDVEVITALDSVGPWTVKLQDTKSTISGGDFTIKVADIQPGLTWTYTDREIFGLEGFHTSPDPRLDTGIRSASLAQSLDEDDEILYIENDWMDSVKTRITANHGSTKTTYIWIGNECMATVGACTVDGSRAFHVSVERGVWKTRAQYHPLNYAGTGAVIVSDVPLGGIRTGRPYYLYAIPINSSGTPTTSNIALINSGIVHSSPDYRSGMFSLKCSGWWKSLDKDVRIEKFEGSIRGYWLSRGDDDTRDTLAGNGHLVILEKSPVDSLWRGYRLWLCAQNDDVYFEDWTQLKEAIQTELRLMDEVGTGNNTDDPGYSGHGSDGTRYLYEITEDGIQHQGTAPTAGDESFVAGPLAWVLGLGPPNEEAAGVWYPMMEDYNEFYLGASQNGGAEPTTSITDEQMPFNVIRRVATTGGAYNDYEDYTPAHSQYGPNWRAQYAYQWGWFNNTDYNAPQADVPMNVTRRKWPHTASRGGDGYFYVDSDYNIDLIDTDNDLYVGSKSMKINNVRTYSKSSIASVDTTNRYINIGATNCASYFGQTNIDHLKKASGSAADNDGPFRKGAFLYYLPNYHNSKIGGDPWKLSQQYVARAGSAVDIFKGLLGDSTSTLSIPDVVKLWTVQDALTETVDLHPAGSTTEFYEMIDWDTLDEYMPKIIPGQFYELEFDDSMNFWSLFAEELKLHGITPTWEFDYASHQFVMRFRRVGLASPSVAYQEARTLDDDDRQQHAAASFKLSADWMFNSVEASFHYDSAGGSDGSYMFTVVANENSGYEQLAGNARALKVKSKLTKIDLPPAAVTPDEVSLTVPDNVTQAIVEHFVLGTLAHSIWPAVECSVDTVLGAFVKYGIGTTMLVTDPTPINAYGLGGRGLTQRPSLCSGMMFDPMKGTTKTSYRLSRERNYNIAPSCLITSSVVTDNDNIEITGVASNTFNRTLGREDVTYFHDLSYNPSLGGDLLEQSTDTFYVTVWERSTTADPRAGDGGLVFEEVQVSNFNTSTYAFDLTKTDIGLTWDVNADFVMVFAQYDGGNLADSQKRWIYLADSDGGLNDGATNSPGNEWE